MKTSRWPEIDRLFHLAAERQGAEREAFLAAACGSETELRREIESLLHADQGTVSMLDRAAFSRFDRDSLAVGPGDQLGPYRIGRQIGEGGMGIVFEAERDDVHFQRRVAVKLLKQALLSSSALGRFHNECRLLARLEHPNVARLYDAGTTAAGVAYMVMEYVEGQPIDTVAKGLEAEGVVKLFLPVCDAVACAHRHLIVHRDLKPGNVLVNAEGIPKLLDFGIAKLLDSAGASATRSALQPMTPRYASPEQLRGDAVTTATDVYSLGLLLYELLTGRLPESAAGDGADPAPPSTIVTDPQLRKRLRGDLDTIVCKALAVDAARRYPSLERFGDDLRRHLEGLPVLARRPTWGYRTRRFVERHTWAAALTSVFVALLAAAVVAMTIFARDAARQRDRARIESATASEVTKFLIHLIGSSRPEEHQGHEPKVREILDRGAEQLRTDLGQAPEVRAALFQALGEAFLSLSRFDDAAPLLEAALALRCQTLGDDHPEVAATRLVLANVEQERSRFDHAETLVRQALEAYEARPGADEARRAKALEQLGGILARKGDLAAAEDHLRRSLALRHELFDPSHPEVGYGHLALAELFYQSQAWADAEASYERAIDVLGPALGEADPLVLTLRHNLANVRQSLGDGGGALATYKEILAIQRQLYGDVHAEIAATLNSLGTTYYELGDLERCEEHFRAAIDMRRRLDRQDTVEVALMLSNLGRIVEKRGRLREAAQLYREALSTLQLRLGEGAPAQGLPMIYLGRALVRLDRAAEAEKLLRRADELLTATLGETHYRVDMARIGLAECLMRLGRDTEAESLARASLERLQRQLGEEHRLTRQAAELLERVAASADSPSIPEIG